MAGGQGGEPSSVGPMVTRAEKWPAGTPCWVEITVSDLARSQEFYRSVLGWDFEDSGPEYGHYANALVGGRRVAGISPPMEGAEAGRAFWTTYLATDEIGATAEAAADAGAHPVLEPMEVGAFGRIGLWVDPAGAAFGAWEARDHTGWDVQDEHGAVGWVDLVTPDVAASKAFYRSIFGLRYEDLAVPGIHYTSFTPPGGQWPVGGIGDQDSGDHLGPRWCVTFAVDDVDAARRRVLRAGGSTESLPIDVETGRIVTVTGPDGEEFSLMSSTEVSGRG